MHLLMIYPDQHPCSLYTDDLVVQRISLAAYNTHYRTELRGHNYHQVVLREGVTLTSLQSNADAWTALKHALMLYRAPIFSGGTLYWPTLDGNTPLPVPVLDESEPGWDVDKKQVTKPTPESERVRFKITPEALAERDAQFLPWATPRAIESPSPILFFHNNPQNSFDMRSVLEKAPAHFQGPGMPMIIPGAVDGSFFADLALFAGMPVLDPTVDLPTALESGLQVTFTEDETAPVLNALGHWTVPDSSSVPPVPALEAWTERFHVVHDRLTLEDSFEKVLYRFAANDGNKAVFVSGALLPTFMLYLKRDFFDPEDRTDHCAAGILGTMLGIPFYTDVHWAPGERFIDGIELRIDYDEQQ